MNADFCVIDFNLVDDRAQVSPAERDGAVGDVVAHEGSEGADFLFGNSGYTGSFACGIRANGTAWCWGSGVNGELGNGQSGGGYMSTTPVQVGTSGSGTLWSDWVTISGGNLYACGVRANGTAWCWGGGNLGNGTGGTSNIPVQVVQEDASPGGATWSDWVTISAGSQPCGIRVDGSAWCWGDDSSGQLGDGSPYAGAQFTPQRVFMEGVNGCVSPDGDKGDVVYNADYNVMQWCDGAYWTGFKKTDADKIVFITSTTQTGNLGGVAGADGICNTRAAAGSLPGTYKAWIATTAGNDPASSFTKKTVLNQNQRYRLTNGTVIANNWDDLVDGTLAAAINRDEFNNAQTGEAWSNADSAGVSVGTVHCTNWTTSSGGSNRGRTGSSASTTATWANTNNPTCSNALRLYCFQQ